jgi:hypothetical protein
MGEAARLETALTEIVDRLRRELDDVIALIARPVATARASSLLAVAEDATELEASPS